MAATQDQNASSMKRLKTVDNNDGDLSRWPTMVNDILMLIILRLGVVDFVAFSGVCKEWRKVAFSNRKMFMLSKQPMPMRISTQVAKRKKCFLEDCEGRSFTTILPRSSRRACVGIICGYLILHGRATGDFRLLNPITMRELRFPPFPFYIELDPESFRCTLVYLTTMSAWAFVISTRFSSRVSFSFSSKRASWTHIFSNLPISDLHYFQGKIYALDVGINLFEVRLGPEPALTPLKMKDLVRPEVRLPEFAVLGEKLYLIGYWSTDEDGTVEVDLEQMRWTNPTKILKEHAWFASILKCGFAKEFWMVPRGRKEWFAYFYGTDKYEKKRIRGTVDMWYCPHKCLDDNRIHE